MKNILQTIKAFIASLFLILICSFTTQAQWSSNPALNNAICTAANSQYSPTIISDGSGGAIITWQDQRSGNFDIYAQRINASGVVQWTANGVAICTAIDDQLSPTIVSDGLGGAIITWNDNRSAIDYDIYVQRINASGVVQWTTNGVAICTAANDQTSPIIVSDGSGGAIITWLDQRTFDFDFFAQRISASGAVQWTANGVAICTAAFTQESATMVSDGSGGAFITWNDARSGTYDIYVQRINALGAVQLTVNGVAICTATGAQYFPTIVSDASGGAIITWQDLRSGSSYDIYAQRINGSGAVQWSANGVAICTAADGQYNPTIVSDASGGALITWIDLRSSGYGDIYAQRINGSGAVQWAANGVAICTATGIQSNQTIVSDGSGGAIITWQDYRSGSTYDIYTQRINTLGAVQWTANGIAISTATGDQLSPTIVSNGSGGAIMTWYDSRIGSTEIYAQNVNANATLGLLPPEINVQGNSNNIADGDNTPSTTDSTQFGNAIVGSSKTRTFTIQNTGTGTLTITSITSSNPLFTVSALSPASPIPASGSATFTVTFSPTAVGAQTSTITINNNDADEGVYNFDVQATGTYQYKYNGTGSWLTTANWDPEYPGLTIPVGYNVYGNPGESLVIPSGTTITANGFIFHDGSMTVAGNLNNNNSVRCITISNHGIITNALGSTMIADYGVLQNFSTGQILNSGTLNATNGASFSNNGTIINYIGGTVTNNINFFNSGSYANMGSYKGSGFFSGSLFNNDISGIVSPGNSPGCQSFGNGFATSGTLNIEVNGTATACTDYDKITVTGSATLDGILNVSIGYTPSNGDLVTFIDATTLSGTFATVNAPLGWNISYNNPSTGKVTLTYTTPLPEINVQGNSITILDGDNTPNPADHTNFGSTVLGNNLVRTFTIQNTGSADLNISNITSSNVLYLISGAPSLIIGGGTATFTVTFNPIVAGTISSTITIHNNDADEGVYNFDVQATALQAQTSLSISGASSSLLGSATIFTATLNRISAPTGAVVGEIVTFSITNPFGSTQTGSVVTNSLGQASYSYTSAMAGVHSVQAGFAGTLLLAASNASGLSHTVTNPCTNPTLPGLSASNNSICTGGSTTISVISGSLNNATSWQWYTGSCGGISAGSGNSITVSPTTTTTYYVRGEGGCVTPGLCDSIKITVKPLPNIHLGAPDDSVFCPGVTLPLRAFIDTVRMPFNNSGLAGGTPISCHCPPGYVAVGYNGRTGSWLDKIQLACRKLNTNGTLDPAVVYTTTMGGNGGSPNGPYLLSGDTVLVGADFYKNNNYLTWIKGYGQPISHLMSGGNNSSSPVAMATMGAGTPSSFFNQQFASTGQVIVGLKGWVNGFVPGLSLITMPISRVAGNTYLWSNGSTDSVINVSAGGTYSVTLSDANGCTATSSIQMIERVVAAFSSCPTNIVEYITSGCDKTVTYSPIVVGTAPLTQTYVLTGVTVGSGSGTGSGLIFNKGVTNVKLYVSNICGIDSCQFTVTVLDTIKPSINCLGNISVNNESGLCGATVVYSTPTFSDNCNSSTRNVKRINPNLTSSNTLSFLNLDIPVGAGSIKFKAFGDLDLSTEKWTFLDEGGNTLAQLGGNGGQCSTVYTSTIPVSLATLNNWLSNGSIDFTVNSSVDVNTSLCSGDYVEIEITYPNAVLTQLITGLSSGSFFPVGTTINQFVATDNSGNSDTCSFSVTVVDTTKPTITCSGPVTINNTPGQCIGTTTLTAPNVTDNCSVNYGNALNFDGSNDFVIIPGSNTSGFNTSTYTAEAWIYVTGGSGSYRTILSTRDQASSGWIIYVEPSTNYITLWNQFSQLIVSTSPVTFNQWTHIAATGSSSGQKLYVNGVLQGSVSNVVSPAPNIAYCIGMNDQGAINFPFVGHIDEARFWNVERTQSQIQASMNSELVGTESGLVSYFNFNQGIAGGTNTGITTANATTGPNGTLNNFALSGSTSNWVASQTVGLTVTNDAPSTYPIGNTTVTWTATDANGNSNICTQIVTVVDTSKPTIVCPGNISQDNDAGLCSAVVNFAVTSSDNCPGQTVAQVLGLASGSAFPTGTTTNKFIVIDASGNKDSCSFTVTITDTSKPAITCTGNITQDNDAGQCSAIVNYTMPLATDNCQLYMQGNQTFTFNGTIDTFTVPSGVTSLTISAIGAQGGNVNGGLGANMVGTFNVTPGQTLGIVVGGQGTANNCGGPNASGGGGGGTFVWDISNPTTPLLVAGGGGGGNTNWSGTCTNGINASITINGTQGNGATSALGGVGGNGGFGNAPSGTGSGGAGWLSAGQNSAYGTGSTGGQSPFSFLGGNGSTVFGPGGTGGFGGGGGAVCGCGGGGGYSGGGGGEGSSCRAGGGGGGSFNAGTNQANSISSQTGNGLLTLSWNSSIGATISQTSGLPSGAAFPVGTTVNKFIATDASGNKDSCSFTVTITDTTKPTITCSGNITQNNDAGLCSTLVNYTITSSDNCPGQTIAQVSGLASGSAFPVGTTTNKFIVTDASGNKDSCSFTVTITDTTKPTITCPGNISQNNDGGLCSAVVNFAVTSSDNCSGQTVAQVSGLASGSAFPVGTTTNKFIVTDASGNKDSCFFTVTITDTSKPTITCPGNISQNNDAGLCSAVVHFVVTSSDNCPGQTVAQVSGLASGATFPVGTTTNKFIVTDASGNKDSCLFTVTVVDTAKPSITCPGNITQNNDAGLCSAIVNYSVASSDNCIGQTVAQASGLASGSAFPLGTTINKFIVTDASGNKDSCTFTVTIIDTTKPTIVCSGPVTINNTSGLCTGTTTLPAPTVTDNCSNIGNALNFDGSNDRVPVGTGINLTGPFTIEAWVKPTLKTNFSTILGNKVGSFGNPGFAFAINNFQQSDGKLIFESQNTQVSSVSSVINWGVWQHISITYDGSLVKMYKNGTPIVLNNPSAINLVSSGNPAVIGDFFVLVSAGKFLGSMDELRVWNVARSQSQIAANLNHELNAQPGLVAAYHFNQGVAGGNNTSLPGPAINTAIDASGNLNTGILSGFALNGPTSNWVTGATMGITLTNDAPITYPIGNTTVTWTATDSSGNTNSCTQIVTVIDNQKPTIVCPGNITQNNDAGLCTAVVNYTTPVGTDNCTGASTVQTQGLASGAVFPVGTTTNKFIVTDASGNKDSCSFTVTVNDTQRPNISCPSSITVNNTSGVCSKVVSYSTPIGTDNCSGATTLQTEGLPSGSSFPNGVTINKFVVTDASGNKDSCWFTVTVMGVSLQAKAILDGPYVPSLGLMQDSLRVYGLIPTIEPYSAPPFNRTPVGELGGETVSSSVLTLGGNNAIVDWVLLELRSASNPVTVVANKRALIQRDGDIVSAVDGVSPVFFANTLSGNYYVSVKHRNHLGVMTSNPISIGGCSIPILDFTTTSVYVNPLINNSPRKQVGSIYTLWSADNNFNKNVKYNGLSNDKDAVLTSLGGPAFINATLTNVYRAEDGNMDGKIRFNNTDNDRAVILNTVGVNTPNAILNQHTPN